MPLLSPGPTPILPFRPFFHFISLLSGSLANISVECAVAAHPRKCRSCFYFHQLLTSPPPFNAPKLFPFLLVFHFNFNFNSPFLISPISNLSLSHPSSPIPTLLQETFPFVPWILLLLPPVSKAKRKKVALTTKALRLPMRIIRAASLNMNPLQDGETFLSSSRCSLHYPGSVFARAASSQ